MNVYLIFYVQNSLKFGDLYTIITFVVLIFVIFLFNGIIN